MFILATLLDQFLTINVFGSRINRERGGEINVLIQNEVQNRWSQFINKFGKERNNESELTERNRPKINFNKYDPFKQLIIWKQK